MANDARIMMGTEPEEVEEVVDGTDGRNRVWLSVKAPLRDNDGNSAGLAGVSIEITERRQIERKLQRVQAELLNVTRSTIMGEMASTLAHELNQPLGAIAAYMSGCRRILDRPTIDRVSLQEGFEGAAEQALRAGYIIKQIRAFIPRNESKPTAEDISEVVREFIALSGFQTPGLTITQNLDPSPILVLVDKMSCFRLFEACFAMLSRPCTTHLAASLRS